LGDGSKTVLVQNDSQYRYAAFLSWNGWVSSDRDGHIVAVRMWASTTFNSVWISLEGHVLHVNALTDVITVENELGAAVPLTLNANPEFFYRTPASAQADATPISTGVAFLSSMVRGFKVHASVLDPLASPLGAQTIDIETARYDGSISGATAGGFTYTRNFHTASDDYVVVLPYISSSTTNGADPASGTAITGFKWWDFTFPPSSRAAPAVSTFESAPMAW
jgi:hypothetical protein